MKRLVIISDLHCGSQVALTPPSYQRRLTYANYQKHNKFVKIQQEGWKFYSHKMRELSPIDILIVNGDCIDGRKSPTELIEPDRIKQAGIAVECINYANAKRIIMTYGTNYHVSDEGEDIEDLIAERLGCKIGAHEWLNINGLIFDIKHKVGASGVPAGRHGAISRSMIWNKIWAERKQQPNANIYIRSHTHYFDYCGNSYYLAIITPALQGMGSKYGSRECEGAVDFGLISFDISDNGSYEWQPHLLKMESQKARALIL